MKNKVVFCVIGIVVLICLIIGGIFFFRNSNSNNVPSDGRPNGTPPSGDFRGGPNGQGGPGGPGGIGGPGNGSSNVNAEEAKASKVVTDSDIKFNNITIESNNTDESIIRVSNGGSASIGDATLNKISGDSTNTEDSEFYGINAGVLTTKGSTTSIKNSKINTNAKGSNAVFATGENAKIFLYDVEIATTGSSSARGLDSTYGGYIEADKVNISTRGGSCATLATDRGEGTVIARNSKLSTAGVGSPIIYSTGTIKIEDTEGTAKGSQMVVVEGKNSAEIIKSTLKASGRGNRNNVDNCGVMIYQSMSQDAAVGTGSFSATDSVLEITEGEYYKTAPFFFVTNTDAKIYLKNNTMKYGSNLLLKVAGTNEWGNSGSNGGSVTLSAYAQKLEGNIEVDEISSATIELYESTNFTGVINTDNVSKNVNLKLDSTSNITLTGDSYVLTFENADATNSNINFNGYSLYVNGNKVN